MTLMMPLIQFTRQQFRRCLVEEGESEKSFIISLLFFQHIDLLELINVNRLQLVGRLSQVCCHSSSFFPLFFRF